MDYPATFVLPGQRFAKLLKSPGSRRVARDVDMKDSSAFDVEDHEDVEHLKSKCHGSTEIASKDGFPVISQKCRPGLASSLIPVRRRLRHVFSHRSR